MNTNDNRLKAHKLIDHIFQDLLPAHGMAQRPEQIQLSHRMLDAMQDGRIALCDAGTGIGKTYAYLAAATAASAFPTGQIARPIIISTSSIALQNAVLTEYLPLLSCVLMADGILTKPLKAVIRKGKSHYVCDERLDRRLRQVNLAKKNPEALAALRTLKETLDMDGVSHLSGYDRERVCVPQVCDCKQKDCRYQRFLKTCDRGQFLFQICNHNLLVADAIHRSEGKRPIFPEHSIIIVDEAHKLPETAQQMLGVTLTVEEIRNLILQLKEERYLLAAEMLEDSTGPLLRKLAQPREEAEPVEACLRLLTAPSCTLPIIQRQIGSLLSPLGSRQLNTVLDAVKLFTSSQTDMIFYTAEDVSTGGAMLCAAAGDITQRIKKILWQPDQVFVLTSGTMAVGSDFRRFKTQAGLKKGHRVMESVSPSPFDYRNNCLLYLPQIPPRQRVEDTDVYFNELTAELVGLIKAASGHALVLFTSYAAMSAVKERLREESLPFPLLTLGRNAPHIIEQFRHTPGAVLLATGAAWEGFDFPGDCVSLLIIPRLPFAYQIRNGALEIVPEEQRTVSMVFTLYNAGASYQAISDALNRQSIPYCREVPLWNKHKVKRLLENPRYTGKEGYPILVEADIFQAAQEKTAEKNAGRQSHGEKPAIARLTPYFRCSCGRKMTRLGGGWQNSGKLYLRCEGCGNTAVMDMDATVNGIVRQFRDHEQPSCTAYTPSAEVMRLDNAINRGLEQPDSPEAVMALILQGAAARYACCPEPSAESEPSDSLTEADWRRFQRAVSHITISQDTEVTLIFTDKKATGKDE